ncbi:MAG: DUF4126 domain-containing protein [Ilumatobacteraceae bacterium]
METAVLVVAGWCSGVNAYLTVLVLGVAGRLGWTAVPAGLEQPWVLGAAGTMFAIEFVVDKVPLLDSAWDVVHTLVRPGIAAVVGTVLADDRGLGVVGPGAAALAAGLALVGHTSKATTRLAINMSPEPFTNVAASVGEDGLVTSLMLLAVASPRLAAAVTLVVAVAGLVLAWTLIRFARRGIRVVRRWLARGGTARPSSPPR